MLYTIKKTSDSHLFDVLIMNIKHFKAYFNPTSLLFPVDNCNHMLCKTLKFCKFIAPFQR